MQRMKEFSKLRDLSRRLCKRFFDLAAVNPLAYLQALLPRRRYNFVGHPDMFASAEDAADATGYVMNDTPINGDGWCEGGKV